MKHKFRIEKPRCARCPRRIRKADGTPVAGVVHERGQGWVILDITVSFYANVIASGFRTAREAFIWYEGTFR